MSSCIRTPRNLLGIFSVVACASAHVLTLHPKEQEGLAALDSRKRLDLVSQFRRGKPGVDWPARDTTSPPKGKEQWPLLCFSFAAGPTGQCGIALCVLKTWLGACRASLVLCADHRLLVVRLRSVAGTVQVLVAHALEASYASEDVAQWRTSWATFACSNL